MAYYQKTWKKRTSTLGANMRKKIVEEIAAYLKISIYQLFEQARKWESEELPPHTSQGDYDEFIESGTVPNYVIEYCNIVIDGMD
jgi:hypothetical protein